MQSIGIPGEYGLDNHGLRNLKTVYWNLLTPALIEQVVQRNEGELTIDGAVAVRTGKHTGRSPGDKFVVIYGLPEDEEIWCGKINQAFEPANFQKLYARISAYLQGRDVFIQDMLIGAHPVHHLPVRVITEYAWHSLFSHALLRRLPVDQQCSHIPSYTVIACPGLLADPDIDETSTGTFIVLDFHKRLVLIGGTSYAGEIKKSVFTIMNYEMPRIGVLPMHCSANVGLRGDVALFFGLSGTGKTTLSSDPDRKLIGDDEHGWADDGIFNFEGGCYAKMIRLRPDLEPIIWEAARRYGAVLENVIVDPDTRELDFDDDSLTENTRGAYPLDFVRNHVEEGWAGHPKNIFFLTADAFGVLPPIARLTPEQAMYYFLSGYTSKLAGTEKDLGKEPQATFSTCFGAPFLPLHPRIYSNLLGDKIQKHQVKVWLLNTGWTGGPYGIGNRIRLPYTRAMIRAALTGQFEQIPMRKDSTFGLWIPESCPDVPAEVLDPMNTWTDPNAYREQARGLIARFEKNFEQFVDVVPAGVCSAGPANSSI